MNWSHHVCATKLVLVCSCPALPLSNTFSPLPHPAPFLHYSSVPALFSPPPDPVPSTFQVYNDLKDFLAEPLEELDENTPYLDLNTYCPPQPALLPVTPACSPIFSFSFTENPPVSLTLALHAYHDVFLPLRAPQRYSTPVPKLLTPYDLPHAPDPRCLPCSASTLSSLARHPVVSKKIFILWSLPRMYRVLTTTIRGESFALKHCSSTFSARQRAPFCSGSSGLFVSL